MNFNFWYAYGSTVPSRDMLRSGTQSSPARRLLAQVNPVRALAQFHCASEDAPAVCGHGASWGKAGAFFMLAAVAWQQKPGERTSPALSRNCRSYIIFVGKGGRAKAKPIQLALLLARRLVGFFI